jgi:hypothetical protein
MKQIERLMMDPCISAQIAARLRKDHKAQPVERPAADAQRWRATLSQLHQVGNIPAFAQLEQLLNADGPVAFRI